MMLKNLLSRCNMKKEPRFPIATATAA
jgi:hypothetical protein